MLYGCYMKSWCYPCQCSWAAPPLIHRMPPVMEKAPTVSLNHVLLLQLLKIIQGVWLLHSELYCYRFCCSSRKLKRFKSFHGFPVAKKQITVPVGKKTKKVSKVSIICDRAYDNQPCEHKLHRIIFSLISFIRNVVSHFRKLQKKACSSDEILL